MGKMLIIADQKGVGYATPRGLELARRLGYDIDVVAFIYAPLKRLKLKAPEQASVKKRLLEDREQEVQKRIDKNARDGQNVKLKVVWEKNIDNWVNRQCASGKYLAVIKTGSNTDSLVQDRKSVV